MSRRNSTHSGKAPPFIMLLNNMVDSEAFQSLSYAALRVFLSILRQRKSHDHGTSEDNPLICPYSDITGLKSTASISKGIQELEDKGFISGERGGLEKRANRYVLSSLWMNWCIPTEQSKKKKTKSNFKKQKTTSNIEEGRLKY